MLKLKRQLSLLALLILVAQLFAQGPNNSGTYYKTANGQKGKALKTALFKIISNHKEIGYKNLWACYSKTDARADGKVWDMYSCTTNFTFGKDQAGSYSNEGDAYNREHSFPKSWFNKATPMYTDLVHLVPTDGYVNGRRGNYPFGETKGETYKSNNDFSKLGSCTYPGYSGIVFEPNDEYKGDFARIYFYMATCYEDKIANWKCDMLAGNSYPAYTSWALSMLLKWAKEDPVSQKEIDRNNAVYGCQQNRNPYVDYPGLEQYVWGDSTDVAFSYDNYGGASSTPDPKPDPNPNPDPNPDPDPDPTPDPVPGDGYVFSKVTSTADLVPGAYYLIVYEDGKKALAGKSGSKSDVRGYADVTISSDAKITTVVNESGKPRQLLLGVSEGAYTFYDAVGKEYLALTSDDNKLQASSTVIGNVTKWTVTISGGLATINNCRYNNREIMYNISSPRFACYKGTQQPVSLYRRVSTTGVATLKPTVGDGRVDVYTISGVLIRRQVPKAAALGGLDNGVYVVNGKKVTK